jgi:hypothetical protein
LTISGITATGKTYDGNSTASVSTSAVTKTGLINGDDVTITATGSFVDKNVARDVNGTVIAKAVNLSSIYAGLDKDNYAITGQATASATISPLDTATYIGAGSSDSWNDALNWAGQVRPETGNVLNVKINATKSDQITPIVAEFDLPSLTLNSIDSDGTFKLGYGVLNVNSSLRTLKYEQVGGSLNGTGTVTVDQLFSKSGGSIDVSGKVKITQASGNLVVSDVLAPTIQLTALNGSISFTNAGATKAIVFEDTSGSSGITIDNKGGVTLAGATRSTGGGVSVTARSPLTVTGSGIQAAGNVSLTTTNETSAGTMTVNAPVTSTGGGLTLSASGAYTQNSALSAAGGVSVSAASMSYGAGATTDGNPVSYTVGGASVAAPISKAVASSSVQAGSIVSDFLEKLDEAVEEQLALATTEDEEEKRRRAELEGQGEICLR